MSGPGPPYRPLAAAVTKEQVEASFYSLTDHQAKKVLLKTASELVSIQDATVLTGPKQKDRNSPTLQVLIERLEKGYHSPFSGLPNAPETPGYLKFSCTGTKDPMHRPLGDFEDLYYSLVATVKAMHQMITLRLNNGFERPDTVFDTTKGLTVLWLTERLVRLWVRLNDTALVQALDTAIQGRHEEGSHFEEPFAQKVGLNYIGDEHPAMINGKLNEKYRSVFRTLAVEKGKQGRQTKKVKKVKKVKSFKNSRFVRKSSESLRSQASYEEGSKKVDWQLQQQLHEVLPARAPSFSMGNENSLYSNEPENKHENLSPQQAGAEHFGQVQSSVQEDQSSWDDYAPPHGFIHWGNHVVEGQDEGVQMYTESVQDVAINPTDFEHDAEMAMDLDTSDYHPNESSDRYESRLGLPMLAHIQSNFVHNQSNFFQGPYRPEGEFSGWSSDAVQGPFMSGVSAQPTIEQRAAEYHHWLQTIMGDSENQPTYQSNQVQPNAYPDMFGVGDGGEASGMEY